MLAKRVTTLFFTLAVLMMFTPHVVVADGHETREREKISLCSLLFSVSQTAFDIVCGRIKDPKDR